MIYIYILIAAAISSRCLTRLGMRILTTICPHFFNRLEWIFLQDGLTEGLYDYASFINREDDVRKLEGELLGPLTKASFFSALIVGELVAVVTNIGIFGAIIIALLTSLLPFYLGFLLVGVFEFLLWRRGRSLRDELPFYWDPEEEGRIELARSETAVWLGQATQTSASFTAAYARDDYPLADRLYDYFADRSERFKADPLRSVVWIDRAYDWTLPQLLKTVRVWSERKRRRQPSAAPALTTQPLLLPPAGAEPDDTEFGDDRELED